MPNTYTTVQGDMWDLIAYKQMGSEMYMHHLMSVNLRYREVTVFPAGVILTIPTISTPVGSKLPPWFQVSS